MLECVCLSKYGVTYFVCLEGFESILSFRLFFLLHLLLLLFLLLLKLLLLPRQPDTHTHTHTHTQKNKGFYWVASLSLSNSLLFSVERGRCAGSEGVL